MLTRLLAACTLGLILVPAWIFYALPRFVIMGGKASIYLEDTRK